MFLSSPFLLDSCQREIFDVETGAFRFFFLFCFNEKPGTRRLWARRKTFFNGQRWWKLYTIFWLVKLIFEFFSAFMRMVEMNWVFVMKYQHIVLLFFSGSNIFKIDVPEMQCSSCQTFRSGGHYRVHTQRPSVEGFRGTSQSLLINVAVVLQIMPRRLPCASSPIYCSLFILSIVWAADGAAKYYYKWRCYCELG